MNIIWAQKPDRGQEKGATKDEMVGWHCRLSRHEFEQIPRDRKFQDREKPGVLQSVGSQRVRHDVVAV